MGKGRKPAKTDVLNLRGSRHGKNRPTTTGPRALLNLPRPPKNLTKSGRKLWKDLGGHLVGIHRLTEADLDALELLVSELDTYHRCQEEIKTDGLILKIYKERKDKEPVLLRCQRHPAHAIAQLAIKNVLRLLAEFGITPAARVNIRIPAELPSEDDLKDELMEGFGS